MAMYATKYIIQVPSPFQSHKSNNNGLSRSDERYNNSIGPN